MTFVSAAGVLSLLTCALAPFSFAETSIAPATVTDTAKPRWSATPVECDRAVEALKRVKAWQTDGGVKNTRKLYVVYFTPTDRKPFPGYKERLERSFAYIRDYYAHEMVSNGLPPMSFPLETDAAGHVVIHEAHGDKPQSGYGKYTNAGKESREAANAVLKAAGIDGEHNHVLIVCQMKDGVAPYYGDGTQSSGVCWTCDLAGLDSANLTSSLDKKSTLALATNDEDREAFRNRALGPHTSVYIGGIAHELGHCFNLPHTGESPADMASHGVSLMGQGTFTFGEELRDPHAKGTFLAPTDALSLISQPIFTGYDKRVEEKGEAVFADLVAKPGKDAVVITGRIASANVPAYAVVINLAAGKSGGDYRSTAGSSLVDPKTGEFSVTVSRFENGPVDLVIRALHMNGAKTIIRAKTVSRGYAIDTDRLNKHWSAKTADAPVAAK